MTTKPLLLLMSLALGVACAEEGFTPLFNGKNLDGWEKVNGTGEFRVEGTDIVGVGVNVKSNTFLRTKNTFTDFEFRFEMKFDDLSGNSGMMFRGMQKEGVDGRVYGYQCEHDNRKDRAWTAGLYDEARRGWLQPPTGDAAKEAAFTKEGNRLFQWEGWNRIRIVCKGNHIQIWLNDEPRVDFVDDSSDFTPEGFFALQVHSGASCRVRWRNLEVKEL